MKKFEITKKTFAGSITVIYDENILQIIDFSASGMFAEQRKNFKNLIPAFAEIKDLEEFAKKFDCTIREVQFVISFEQWYNEYSLKRN
jgi:hypothetical protein